jgi:hypothetical protein
MSRSEGSLQPSNRCSYSIRMETSLRPKSLLRPTPSCPRQVRSVARASLRALTGAVRPAASGAAVPTPPFFRPEPQGWRCACSARRSLFGNAIVLCPPIVSSVPWPGGRDLRSRRSKELPAKLSSPLGRLGKNRSYGDGPSKVPTALESEQRYRVAAGEHKAA